MICYVYQILCSKIRSVSCILISVSTINKPINLAYEFTLGCSSPNFNCEGEVTVIKGAVKSHL